MEIYLDFSFVAIFLISIFRIGNRLQKKQTTTDFYSCRTYAEPIMPMRHNYIDRIYYRAKLNIPTF